MVTLIHAPVELPSCICPQFVITRIGFFVDDEIAKTSSVIHLQQLPFHEIPFVVVEFHIEHTTYL